MKKCNNCKCECDDTMQFCPQCGTAFQDTFNLHTDAANFSGGKPIKKKMSKKKKAIIAVSVAFVVLLFTSLTANYIQEQKQMRMEQEAIEEEMRMEQEKEVKREKVRQIINSTPAKQGFAPSLGQMLNTIFVNYTWDCEEQSENPNEFLVTFKGSYALNPNVPMVRQGEISYVVNIKDKTVQLKEDRQGISDLFLPYICGF